MHDGIEESWRDRWELDFLLSLEFLCTLTVLLQSYRWIYHCYVLSE
jgi:hypothetical protein